jgi:putative tryptophan/tyrosine transport system substrate-binding protein
VRNHLISVPASPQIARRDETTREFIALVGGVAAWPTVARAQQPKMPVIGFLGGGTAEGYAPIVTAFRQGLKNAG